MSLRDKLQNGKFVVTAEIGPASSPRPATARIVQQVVVFIIAIRLWPFSPGFGPFAGFIVSLRLGRNCSWP